MTSYYFLYNTTTGQIVAVNTSGFSPGTGEAVVSWAVSTAPETVVVAYQYPSRYLMQGSPVEPVLQPYLTLDAAEANGVYTVTATLTNPPVSGTVYQNTGAQDVEFSIPVTYSPTTTAAATLAVARGSASSPATIFTLSKPAGLTAADGEVEVLNLRVPAGWYWSLTATNATIGTAAGITV